MSVWDTLRILVNQYGVLGVFLVSFLGNVIPYSTTPYLFFIILYAGVVSDPVQHLLITISGGIGAALGKIIVYFFGYSIRHILSDDIRQNIEFFARFFKRSTFIAVFIFAASPLPDDIIYVPLGAMKYDIKKYTIALVLGKIVITGLAVYFSTLFTGFLKDVGKYPDYITIPVLVLVTIYLMYLVAKIDWTEAARRAEEEGLKGVIVYVIVKSLKATLDLFRKKH
jgi:membrane protein DedA with SNARE-associated domain